MVVMSSAGGVGQSVAGKGAAPVKPDRILSLAKTLLSFLSTSKYSTVFEIVTSS